MMSKKFNPVKKLKKYLSSGKTYREIYTAIDRWEDEEKEEIAVSLLNGLAVAEKELKQFPALQLSTKAMGNLIKRHKIEKLEDILYGDKTKGNSR